MEGIGDSSGVCAMATLIIIILYIYSFGKVHWCGDISECPLPNVSLHH